MFYFRNPGNDAFSCAKGTLIHIVHRVVHSQFQGLSTLSTGLSTSSPQVIHRTNEQLCIKEAILAPAFMRRAEGNVANLRNICNHSSTRRERRPRRSGWRKPEIWCSCGHNACATRRNAEDGVPYVSVFDIAAMLKTETSGRVMSRPYSNDFRSG